MTIRSVTLLMGALALAGCNDNNGGGGAGGGGGGGGGAAASDPAHNAAFAAVSGQGGTTTMPQTFTGTFTGGIQAQLNEVNGSSLDPVGFAVGDLELRANWRDGQTGPAFTGTADNFAGEVNGTATTWNGALTATNAAPFNRIDVFDGATICGAIPAGQPCPIDPNSRTSAVTIEMNGNLQADGGTAGPESSLLLSGFVTNDNQGMTGAVSPGSFGAGGFILPDGSIAVVAGQESTFYATK